MDDSLEKRIGKIRVTVKCDHRKTTDFTYHHYDQNGIQIDAYLCSLCLPRYNTMIEAYKLKPDDPQGDDGFDEKLMIYKDPE